MMDTNLVLPIDHRRTRVVFEHYFEEDGRADSEEFVEKSLVASDQVQLEDVGVCESVQVGLESSSYDRGRYSAAREEGELQFHRLLHRDYVRAR